MADSDDDRTVIRPAAATSHTLPVGARLEGIEIVGVIGEGGFGIVYLGYDASLERRVAIKEYMPSSLASRAYGSWHVTVKSDRHRETFEAGLKSFVNEARLLARFDHPSLVKVFRFWQANQTGYMAMPYYEGPTLKAALARLGGPPDEQLLREWLRPLLDALSVMHKEQCFHRDIAPDNILLTEGGPLLLDFGAARRVIGDMTHALTVVLKPGYAPIEQYGESRSMAQGAWTDLYALGSVVHYAITGKPPVSAVERVMGDAMRPLAELAAGHYSNGFLRAIDRALAVHPQDRPQSVQQFRDLLNEGLPADSPERFLPTGVQHSGFGSSGFGASGFGSSGFDPSAVVTSGFGATTGAALRSDPSPAPRTAPGPAAGAASATATGVVTRAAPAPAAPQAEPAPPGRGVRPAWIAAALVVAAAIGAGVYVLGSRPPKAPAQVDPPALTLPPPVVPAVAASAVVTPPPPPAPAAPAPAAAPVVDAAPPAAEPARQAPAGPLRDEAAAPGPAAETPRPAAAARAARAEPPPPNNARVRPSRCSDILQKASLEALDAEETAYLKSECR